MRRVTFQSIFVFMVLLALVLGGCSDFDEMKGQRLLSQAETLFDKGEEGAAEASLMELIAQYPASQAAKTGRVRLDFIQNLREKRERLNFSRILDSYVQVLNGYRSMYAEYPRSIAAMDEGDYFFDFAYFDEITPVGYRVYLLLQDDGSGYRIWCVRAESEKGYAIDTAGNKLIPFEQAAVVEELKGRFTAEAWDDKVVALSPR